MAILAPDELASLRRKLARQISPQTWDKPRVNAAFQAVEDVRVSLALDPNDAVDVRTTTDGRAQAVASARAAGRYSNDILPLVDDWLVEHPETRTVRSVDEARLTASFVSNQAAFDPAVADMPVGVRDATVLTVLRFRVEEVV